MSPLFTFLADIKKAESAAKNERLNRGLKSNIARLGALTTEGSPLASQEEINRREWQTQDLLGLMGQFYTPNQPPLGYQLKQIREPPYTATRKQ